MTNRFTEEEQEEAPVTHLYIVDIYEEVISELDYRLEILQEDIESCNDTDMVGLIAALHMKLQETRKSLITTMSTNTYKDIKILSEKEKHKS